MHSYSSYNVSPEDQLSSQLPNWKLSPSMHISLEASFLESLDEFFRKLAFHLRSGLCDR